MRRVLVVTWALGTASGVLLGLFGVQLVSSRFSTARVSPMSHPEVLRALQAARTVPVATETEIAAPAPPDTSPPSAPPDADPARPSAGSTSTPAPASPASTLPRPGASAGTRLETAAASTSSSTTTTVTTTPPPPETSTTTTTTRPRSKTKTDPKKTDKSTTTTTTRRSTPTTSSQSSKVRTKTISTRGGVVTVAWDDGKVSGKAWPKSGWEMPERGRENGPDKVTVWFWKQGQPTVQVEAWANGKTEVTEWRCSGQWGTPQFKGCDGKKVG